MENQTIKKRGHAALEQTQKQVRQLQAVNGQCNNASFAVS